MNLENVRRDDWIVGGLALLLAIVLFFFPWFHISVGVGPFTVSADSTASGAPDGWLGVLAGIAAIAVIVDLAIERLSPQTTVPAIGGSRATTRLALAGAAAFFMLLKFLFHIHFSLFGWGFYVGVVVVVALVYFAMQARAEETVAPARPAMPAEPSGSPEATTSAGPPGSSGPPTA